METDVATTCSHGLGPLTVTHHHAQFSPLFDSIHFVAFLVPSIPPLARLYNAAYVSESLDSTGIAWSCLPFANSVSHSVCPKFCFKLLSCSLTPGTLSTSLRPTLTLDICCPQLILHPGMTTVSCGPCQARARGRAACCVLGRARIRCW